MKTYGIRNDAYNHFTSRDGKCIYKVIDLHTYIHMLAIANVMCPIPLYFAHCNDYLHNFCILANTLVWFFTPTDLTATVRYSCCCRCCFNAFTITRCRNVEGGECRVCGYFIIFAFFAFSTTLASGSLITDTHIPKCWCVSEGAI